jgi:hypothetical protein
MIKSYSQSGQDIFVSKLLNNKKYGTFLDIGCGKPQTINNTCYLETKLNWTGLNIDIDQSFINEWKYSRVNPFICHNALTFNYRDLMASYYKETVIDYLTLDIDNLYVDVLKRIPFNIYQFRIITIEHDYYIHGDLYRKEEREFLNNLGYKLVCSNVKNSGNIYEDWWVHPDLVTNYQHLECDELEYTDILAKFDEVPSSSTSVLIFSKDRAMQLHALLESIQLYASDVYTNISILYKYSNDEFKRGYELLQSRFPHYNFILETNFLENVKNYLTRVNTPLISFLVDDIILFKSISTTNVIDFFNLPDTLSYIPGVGANTKMSLTADIIFEPPNFDTFNDILLWNWKLIDNIGEFSCPFMLTGNIYKTSAFFEYFNLIKIRFYNPNSFEELLQCIVQKQYKSNLPNICGCDKFSTLVHSANNRVQNTHPNLHGLVFAFEPQALNTRYLNGDVVNIQNYDFQNIIGLHHELDLQFKNFEKK